MPQWFHVVAMSLAAGAAIPIGGLLARVERVHPKWLEQELRHSIIAFGGGALLSAVALVLVPEGIKDLSVPAASVCFLAGGGVFMAIDVGLDRRGTSASQLVGMLADFIPEAIALGAAIAAGSSSALLLALLIAMQNLPEGFNAYREVIGGLPSRRVLVVFCLFALLGPVSGVIGYALLAPYTSAVAALMLFAAGGILYLVFQDIAPQAKVKRRWAPPLGAVAGFLLGLVGHMLVQG